MLCILVSAWEGNIISQERQLGRIGMDFFSRGDKIMILPLVRRRIQAYVHVGDMTLLLEYFRVHY